MKTLQEAFGPAGAEPTLVQNRLNIAALALTALVFAGSFSIALFGSFHAGDREFREDFVYILTALALGVAASVASIACFLQSQHSSDSATSASVPEGVRAARWYWSRQWWFCLGQLLLYVALSQALSASLTEVVFGVSLSSAALGFALGTFALFVWWGLLFVGPVVFLRRMEPTGVERSTLFAIYGILLFVTLLFPAVAYHVRGGDSFVRSFLEQFVQPITWPQAWQVQ
jgi:hypothetical protein